MSQDEQIQQLQHDLLLAQSELYQLKEGGLRRELHTKDAEINRLMSELRKKDGVGIIIMTTLLRLLISGVQLGH